MIWRNNMNSGKFDEVFKSVSSFFNILSNPDRVKILGFLLKKEMDVNELHKSLKISQSRVSQHLKLLKLNNLVEERREGKHVYYHTKDPRVSKVVESAMQFQMLGLANEPEAISLMNELFTIWHV